jgi:hypothetical protein
MNETQKRQQIIIERMQNILRGFHPHMEINNNERKTIARHLSQLNKASKSERKNISTKLAKQLANINLDAAQKNSQECLTAKNKLASFYERLQFRIMKLLAITAYEISELPETYSEEYDKDLATLSIASYYLENRSK